MLLVSMTLERYLRVARGDLTSRTPRDEKDPVGVLGTAGSVILTLTLADDDDCPSFDARRSPAG